MREGIIPLSKNRIHHLLHRVVGADLLSRSEYQGVLLREKTPIYGEGLRAMRTTTIIGKLDLPQSES